MFWLLQETSPKIEAFLATMSSYLHTTFPQKNNNDKMCKDHFHPLQKTLPFLMPNAIFELLIVFPTSLRLSL